MMLLFFFLSLSVIDHSIAQDSVESVESVDPLPVLVNFAKNPSWCPCFDGELVCYAHFSSDYENPCIKSYDTSQCNGDVWGCLECQICAQYNLSYCPIKMQGTDCFLSTGICTNNPGRFCSKFTVDDEIVTLPEKCPTALCDMDYDIKDPFVKSILEE